MSLGHKIIAPSTHALQQWGGRVACANSRGADGSSLHFPFTIDQGAEEREVKNMNEQWSSETRT